MRPSVTLRVAIGSFVLALSSGCKSRGPHPDAGGQRAAAADEVNDTSAAADGPGASTDSTPGTEVRPAPAPQPQRDIDVLSTHLELDVSAHRGVATIEIGPGEAGATLDVGDTTIESVKTKGQSIDHRRDGKELHLALPKREAPVRVTITYRYQLHERPKGAQKTLSLTWPDACGRIFPCRTDPSDGVRFSAELTGVPEGQIALYPKRLTLDAPPYMFGWAYGDYELRELGRTEAGTTVRVAAPASAAADAKLGTAPLLKAFDFLEQTYGPYAFGDTVTSVWVDWGGGAYGGMEHHPHWHVASRDFEDATIHVHEAAHGWFGNGVRIACWEDFVLSEALASYLAARGLEAAGGPKAAAEVWRIYREDLDELGDGPQAARGWPEGCGEHHVLDDGIFGTAPYMRGAFLMRAIENEVGRDALDRSLRNFYLSHRGQAAHFTDLLDAIQTETGFAPHDCARAWLRTPAYPRSMGCE